MDEMREVGRIFQEIMRVRPGTNYVINQNQRDRFVDLVAFFYELADREPEDEVLEVSVDPAIGCGDVVARFTVFYLDGDEDTQRFSKLLQYMSAFTVEVSDDCLGVVVAATIPEVLIPESESFAN